MEQEQQETTQTDLLLIAYACSSFVAFVLAFSKDITPMQSASCFGISCVLALIGLSIGNDLPALEVEEEDDF